MSHQSLPVTPAQPNKAKYGINELALFRQFTTREEYLKLYGVAPPAFDTSRRPKFWRDESVDLTDPEEMIEYLVPKVVNGAWKLVRIMMPAFEAAAVNIPETLPGAIIPGHSEWDGRGRPSWETPVRPLLPNESLFAGFGGLSVCLVARADLAVAEAEAGGEFLPRDRALVEAIAAKLGVTL
jgi:hypothetical protein